MSTERPDRRTAGQKDCRIEEIEEKHTTAIERWEPLPEVTPLREAVTRLLENSFVGLKRFDGFGRVFPMDIRELDGEYVIEVSLPGFTPEDVQITASGDTVTIRAARKTEQKREQDEKQGGMYVRHERYAGTLHRSVTLPHMQADGVQATYHQGVLTLHVPKAPQAKATTIPVTALPEGSSH